MNTQQFKELLAERAQVSLDEASAFVEAWVAIIVQEVQQGGRELYIKGYGTFRRIDTQNGQRIAYTPDEAMRKLINAPFDCFEPYIIHPGHEAPDSSNICAEPFQTDASELPESLNPEICEKEDQSQDKLTEDRSNPFESTTETSEAQSYPYESATETSESQSYPYESATETSEPQSYPYESATETSEQPSHVDEDIKGFTEMDWKVGEEKSRNGNPILIILVFLLLFSIYVLTAIILR